MFKQPRPASAGQLTLRRPDDWHLHLRDGAALRAVLPFTAARFARAIVMPNLPVPITTTALALAYRERIRAAIPAGSRFEPLMTLYLTDHTGADEIARAHASGAIHGCKLYPAGATTHSDAGVSDIEHLEPTLQAMMQVDLPLLVHGELADECVDVFDREARFIDAVLAPLAERYARLRIVFEHVSTRAAVDFVRNARSGVAATITPQHLMFNRNALFSPRATPAPLLPPGAQARIGSAPSDRRGGERQSALLPRHRQRPACASGEGRRLRVCRGIQCARRH